MRARTLIIYCLLIATAPVGAAGDPLPSWNDGPVKKSITDFVAKVTKEGGPDFVAPADRVAVFDNDGCLWSEQPIYFQLTFAIDRVTRPGSGPRRW